VLPHAFIFHQEPWEGSCHLPRWARTSKARSPPRVYQAARGAVVGLLQVNGVDVDPGADEEQGVDPIQHAAVAGDEVARVFDAGGALHERLAEVADRADDRGRQPDG